MKEIFLEKVFLNLISDFVANDSIVYLFLDKLFEDPDTENGTCPENELLLNAPNEFGNRYRNIHPLDNLLDQIIKSQKCHIYLAKILEDTRLLKIFLNRNHRMDECKFTLNQYFNIKDHYCQFSPIDTLLNNTSFSDKILIHFNELGKNGYKYDIHSPITEMFFHNMIERGCNINLDSDILVAQSIDNIIDLLCLRSKEKCTMHKKDNGNPNNIYNTINHTELLNLKYLPTCISNEKRDVFVKMALNKNHLFAKEYDFFPISEFFCLSLGIYFPQLYIPCSIILSIGCLYNGYFAFIAIGFIGTLLLDNRANVIGQHHNNHINPVVAANIINAIVIGNNVPAAAAMTHNDHGENIYHFDDTAEFLNITLDNFDIN